MKKAFTLIELLVVIAIIAILAAILFPVFANAKVAAKQTASLSNVKQLALGILMYSGDVDDMLPQSEYGGGASSRPHVMWYAMIYPYVKSGDRATVGGVDVSWGKDGIFRAPGYPKSPSNAPGLEQQGGFSYGVHQGLFPQNYENDGTFFPSWDGDGPAPNGTVTQTEIEEVSQKIIMMEKGANHSSWGYPWFHPWQQMWVGPILNTPGDVSSRFRDGVDAYDPNWSGYTPVFDSDCTSTSDGAWECAAHPRYRYNGSSPVAFADGHAKTLRKGAVKWFENIWFDRRGKYNGYQWFYDYCIGGGWGFPCIH